MDPMPVSWPVPRVWLEHIVLAQPAWRVLPVRIKQRLLEQHYAQPALRAQRVLTLLQRVLQPRTGHVPRVWQDPRSVPRQMPLLVQHVQQPVLQEPPINQQPVALR